MQKVATFLALGLVVGTLTLPGATAETCTTMNGSPGQVPGTQFYVFKISGYYHIWQDTNSMAGIQPQACGGQSPDSYWGDTEVLGICVGNNCV